MKIQVHKCRFTGKLFENRKDFIKHLKVLRKEFRSEREFNRVKRSRDDFFRNMRETVSSAAELEQFIRDNWKMFCWNSVVVEREMWRRKVKVNEDLYPLLEDVSITLKYSHSISNTHNCPINGGVTNWSGDNDKPRSYPGWSGDIHYTISYPGKVPEGMGFPSDIFKKTGIEIGGGGGSLNSFSFSLTLFFADWPQLAKRVTYDLLKDKGNIVRAI